jgi:hypothetical protein
MAKYTGHEVSTTSLEAARAQAQDYQDSKETLGAADLMNYAYFSTDALEQMLNFCKSDPSIKGVKFNLALLANARLSGKMSLVSWAVDENGTAIDGAATQQSDSPCPPICIPPI